MQYVEAVEQYREMLHSIDEHREEIRTDPLQVLHVVHNLHEVLSMKPPGVGYTLMDSELQLQVRKCKNDYKYIIYLAKHWVIESPPNYRRTWRIFQCRHSVCLCVASRV